MYINLAIPRFLYLSV